jgi:hypothetical protein
MHADVLFRERIELSILRPENRLVVENHPGRVVIRTVQRGVSPSQKSSFIHYLAAEGFIPERYQWFDDSPLEFHSNLKWLVDCFRPQVRPFALRNPLRRIFSVILCASVLWLALMSLAVMHVLP